MNLREALKVLVEGGKIRNATWEPNIYVYMNECGEIFNNDGLICDLSRFFVCEVPFYNFAEWEIHIDDEFNMTFFQAYDWMCKDKDNICMDNICDGVKGNYHKVNNGLLISSTKEDFVFPYCSLYHEYTFNKIMKLKFKKYKGYIK